MNILIETAVIMSMMFPILGLMGLAFKAGSYAIKIRKRPIIKEPLSEEFFLDACRAAIDKDDNLGTEHQPNFTLSREDLEGVSEGDLVESLMGNALSNGRDENSKLIEEYLSANFDGMRKAEEEKVIPIKKPTLALIEGGKKDEVVSFVPDPA